MDQNNQNNQNYQNGQNGQNNQAPMQQQAPAPVAAPTPKAKSNKVLIIAIIVLVVAILGVGGFLIFNMITDDDDAQTRVENSDDEEDDEKESKENKKNNKENGGNTEENNETADGEDENALTAEEADEVEIDEDVFGNIDEADISVIELYPDRVVSMRELETFADIIDERAAVLGSAYTVESDNSKITLAIEKSLLGSTAAERAHTAELLFSRGNINFGTDEYESYSSPTKDNISEINIVELDKADFLLDYRVAMMDERYNQIDLIREDTIYALEIEFTQSGEQSMADVLKYESSEPKMTVIHDYLEEGYDRDYGFFGSMFFVNDDDMSLYYIVSPGAAYQKNAELMKKILEQDNMDFGLVVEIADEPTWETSGRRMGENQKTSMSGETLVVEWTPDKYTRSNRSEVEFAEYEAILKSRMDVLGVDYMFGTAGFDDKTYCIRLYSEDIAPDFVRLIFGDRSVSVRSAFSNVSGLYTPEIVEKNGSYAIRMEAYYYTKEEIIASNNLGSEKLYLVVNDVTIASANSDDIVTDGNGSYLDFENFLCFGGLSAGEEEKNVLELICEINDGEYTYFDGTFRFRAFGVEETADLSLADLDWKYEPLTAEDERVFGLLAGKCYSVDKKVDQRNMLVITLDIPVNDNLPQNFLNKAKELYTLCNFDSGAYNEIHFVIKDEKLESPANEFRLKVTKDSYDGKMEINDSVSGPKFWDYWSDVYSLMNTDSFYSERSW